MTRFRIDGAGYWVSPTDFVVLIRTHISAVCESPDNFGISGPELHRLFEAFKEPYGSEFAVRSHIIRCLVGVGWIRARNYYEHGWTLNAGDLSASLCRAVGFFRLVCGRELDFSPVRFDTPEGVLRREVADFQTCKVLPGGKAPEGAIPVLKYMPDARLIPIDGIPQVKIEIPLFIGHLDDQEADELRAEAKRGLDVLEQHHKKNPELRPKRRRRKDSD